MRQVLFEIPIFGGVKIFGYGMMLFFAFIGSMNLAARLSRREKINPEIIYDLALVVFVGGLIGARMFYVLQYWNVRVHSLAEIFQIWKGGIVLYGSIIGGTIAFFGYRMLRPFPLLPVLDTIAPALALGIAIGRLGCFMNGCCFGDVCTLPWAISFPEPSPPWVAHASEGLLGPNQHWSLPVHPTQLYSAIDGFILCVLLLAYFPIRRRDGDVMILLMMTYPLSRILIEFLRSDERVFLAGMTISQNISVVLFLAGCGFWFSQSRRPPRLYSETHAPTPEALAAAT